jgi:hypothetical protein
VLEINEPTNIIAMEISNITGSAYGEIQILGKDKSASIRVSKTLAGTAYTSLNGLDALIPEDIPLDQGPVGVSDIEEVYFTASYIAFDNSDDDYNTIALFKKGGRNFLKVNLRSLSRADMLAALDKIQNIVEV